MSVQIRVLVPGDDRSQFSSGNPDLDQFFHRFAGQNQFRHHIGVTYVAVDGDEFLGFVTVSRPPGTAPKPLRILDSAGNRRGQSGESPTSMRSHLPPGILAPRPLSLRQSCSWA